MAELEWFPLYWQRFLLGTRDFTTEEVGAYFLLLLHEWDKGFLPETDKELKKISGLSTKKLQNVLKKFKKIDGKLYNDALEIIRIEQTEKAAKYSERGRKGAEERWLKHSISIAQASDKQCLEDAIREEENKKRKEEDETRENPTSENPETDEAKKTPSVNPLPQAKPVQSNLERFKNDTIGKESMSKFVNALGRPLTINRIIKLSDAHDIAFKEKHSHANYSKWCEYFRYFLEKHRETKQSEDQTTPPYRKKLN